MYIPGSDGRYLLGGEDFQVQRRHYEFHPSKNTHLGTLWSWREQRSLRCTSVEAFICMSSICMRLERGLLMPWIWKRSVLLQISYFRSCVPATHWPWMDWDTCPPDHIYFFPVQTVSRMHSHSITSKAFLFGWLSVRSSWKLALCPFLHPLVKAWTSDRSDEDDMKNENVLW